MIVLDTTVLVYAVGGDHPLAEPARSLVQAVAHGRVRATTTPEVVQEFVHVRARRRPRSDAADIGRRFAQLLAPLITVGPEDLDEGLRIFEAGDRIGAFDAVLAATAVARGATALVTADRGFMDIGDLTVIALDTPEFLARLS